METKQTQSPEETEPIDLATARDNVRAAFGSVEHAAGTIQSPAVERGEAHPDKVAREPESTDNSSHTPASPAVIGSPPMEQENAGSTGHSVPEEIPQSLVGKPEATSPVIGPTTQPASRNHGGAGSIAANP